MPFGLLWPCGIVRCRVACYLPLRSFLKSLWLLGVCCGLIQTLRLLYFCRKGHCFSYVCGKRHWTLNGRRVRSGDCGRRCGSPGNSDASDPRAWDAPACVCAFRGSCLRRHRSHVSSVTLTPSRSTLSDAVIHGIAFLTFRSHSSFSVARNAADFCVSTAYPAAFLNLLAPTAFGWSLWGFLCRASRRLQTATRTSCLSTPALDVAFTAHKHLSLGPLSGQHLLPLHK